MPFSAFFTKNPIVGYALAALAAYGIYRGKEELDEARGRRQQQRASEKRARKVQIKISEKNDERLEKAERTRADFRAPASDDEPYRLSDAAIRRLTRSR